MTASSKPKSTILIVDDIPDTVQLLKDWLESHGFQAIGVTSSLEALELAEHHHPDLILLDIMMPKMDGMETCRRLKANPRTAHIPVVIVTAKNPSDARAEGMMAGAVDYITKPVNLMDLIKRVEAAISHTSQEPADVQRLLEEVAHSALTIMPSEMVWLLSVDPDEQMLKSRILATTGGARLETEFLFQAAEGQSTPRFALSDTENPFCAALTTRRMSVNLPVESLKEIPSMQAVQRATELLRLNYLTAVPLTAAGKTPGVMVLGDLQPYNIENPRVRQTLISLGTQAAISLDYSRLISDLKQREAEMRRAEAFRQMILDTMSDGLVVIDNKGEIKYVNRRLLRMTNYARGYLEGRTIGELFHPDDRVEVVVGLLREGIATMKFEQRLITRDNRTIPVWLTRSRAQSDDLNNQVIVLSDMTEQKRREEELERQTSRLLALNRASHAISANLSLMDTLENILNAACEVVEAQGASLFLLSSENPEELVVVSAVGTGADALKELRVPVGQGIAGLVAREARPQLVENIDSDPRFFRGVDEKTGLQTRSLIAVPLINQDAVIGVIEVVNKLNDGLFTQDDVRLLESMAGTAAVSIVNARLFDETQRRVQELATLLDASAAASSTLDLPEVLERIADHIARGLEVNRSTVMGWNPTKERLEWLAESCNQAWSAESAPRRMLSDEPALKTVLVTGQPRHLTLLDSQLDPDSRRMLASSGLVSLYIIPCRLRDEIEGVVLVYSNDLRRPFSAEDQVELHAIVQTWQQDLQSPGHLMRVGENALSDLVQRMHHVERVDWVAVRAWRAGAEETLLLREAGFAEWTQRPGSVVLPIEHYHTLRQVINMQEPLMGTLDSSMDDPAEVKLMTHYGGQSFMAVPLVEKGRTAGIVKIMSQEARSFDDDEVRLAQGIANVVSSAMENARLYESLTGRARALESAYHELQEADKAKDEFIQNVSHELRTPLISVMGYAGLMNEGEFGELNEQQTDAVTTILRKSQQLADIVEDIVSMQALEARTYDRRAVKITDLLNESLVKYQPRAEASGLRFNVRFPAQSPTVFVDPSNIANAFERLLDNAIKFGATGKSIDVVVQDVDGPLVQVAVRDYGIGIPPEEHQKIFRRFYQVDGGTARRYPGTGLGLAIAKAIIEGHGGRIGVRSRSQEGATFIFTLPRDGVMEPTA